MPRAADPHVIGLLMVNEENDILERTLEHNSQWLDAFYALDGTDPNETSREIIEASPLCAGYTHDRDLPRPPFTPEPRCGYRQWLYQQACGDYGPDNWFIVLHADEIWPFHPLEAANDHPGADGLIFPVPFYFPRDGEPWQDDQHPVDQLRWRLGPGWPEFRMFHGNPDVAYDPHQHFNTQPGGLRHVEHDRRQIHHYPYRSPAQQRRRAALHQRTGFDPDNYQHVTDRDAVYWTWDMIDRQRNREPFRDLTREP